MKNTGPITLRRGQVLSPEDFDYAEFNALLANTTGVDSFCSSSSWAESSRRAFMPQADLAVYQHRSAMAVFALARMPEGHRMLLPLDATWTLSSSLAAAFPRRDIPGLIAQILEDRLYVDFCILSGIRPSSTLYRMVVTALAEHMLSITQMRPAHRAVADISKGYDAWFARRSAKFRASVRRAERRTNAAGIRFEVLPIEDVHMGLMDTFHAIERRSWKGREGTGITEQSMSDFVEGFLAQTRAQKQSRILLAHDGDLPIGFILGGVSQSGYRGAQMSFDDQYRSIGLGNAMQTHMIRSLVADQVHTYDLGSSMPYKLRWADYEDRSNSLLIGPIHRISPASE